VSLLVQTPELHRLSIEEYHQLISSGGLDEDSRVELIDGLVVDMSPRSPQHENAIQWLHDWIVDHLDQVRYQIGIARSLTIGSSEPEPDVVILERRPPTLEHPSSAVLVVEVALTSKDRDLRTKPTVYAPAVQEYWVVDLERQVVVVHRQPSAGGYGEVTIVPRGAELRATALELGTLPTDELFAAAFAEVTESDERR
jgi:Uma2 family endonuclease